jgi:ABC-2 type transport system permease protein
MPKRALVEHIEQTQEAPAPPPREGSPWTGIWAVVGKEMSSHMTSTRMRILVVLIVLSAGGTVFSAMQAIDRTTQSKFQFLNLFIQSQDPVPAFVGLLGFLIPLVAIALAFDTINGEFNQRTMSRILAQPIYRDALLLGKFLGGLFTLGLVLATIWLLIFGLGMLGIGVAPSGEEVARLVWFLVASFFYGGVWLAIAIVFSIVFRQPATSALASIAVWLFFTVFWATVAGIMAQNLWPVQQGTVDELVAQADGQITLLRISPNTLFTESTVALLQPTTRSLGVVLPYQLDGMVMGSPLPLDQSVLLIWPQLTGLIAGTILLFALGYVLFQRQEIRA